MLKNRSSIASLIVCVLIVCAFMSNAVAQLPAQEEAERKQLIAAEHYYLASYYIRHWKFKQAQVELEEAIRFYPEFKAAHRNLCLVSLMTTNPLRALAEFSVVIGLGEPIPLTAQECQELDKKAAKMHYELGLANATARKWKNAVAEFQWALVYAPDDAKYTRSLAFAYANLGNFEAAEKQYTTAFASDPKDGFSHADFAFLLSERGQNKRAIQQMGKAVELEPEAAALHVDLGWLAESAGDLAKAESEFAKAVEMCPTYPQLWMHLGRLKEAQGKKEEAFAAYQKALKLNPQEQEAKLKMRKLRPGIENETDERKPVVS
jgi:Tfp pilus assembly protein PilF